MPVFFLSTYLNDIHGNSRSRSKGVLVAPTTGDARHVELEHVRVAHADASLTEGVQSLFISQLNLNKFIRSR